MASASLDLPEIVPGKTVTPNFDTSERDLSGFCWPTFGISMG
jgi:hypothetical protein